MSDDFHGCSSYRAPVPVSKHYFMAIIWSSPFNKSHLMVRLTVELTGHMTSDSIAGTPCVTSPGSSRRVLRQVIVWQELVTLQTSARSFPPSLQDWRDVTSGPVSCWANMSTVRTIQTRWCPGIATRICENPGQESSRDNACS